MFERICIILLFNLIFFLKTVSYKYVSDDIPVAQRPKPKEWWKLRLFQLEGCIRTTPQEDHFLTLVLHALVCVGIYVGFGANDASFLASFLFSINPINNQGSVWISGRGYVLSALGMTWAMAIPYAAPLFLLLATYSNAGFLAPVCFLGSKYAWFMLIVPFIWAFNWKTFRKNVTEKMKMEMYVEDKKINLRKAVIVIKTLSFYFTHSIIPFKTAFYHSYMQSMAGSGKFKSYKLDRFFWVGLCLIGSSIYYLTTHSWNMVSFGLLWWLWCILPFGNAYRMQQEISERYCYLPNCGLMIALATLILQQTPLMAACLIVGFMVMYLTKMWFYMDGYLDDYYLVENSCVNSPDAWFVWHVRGLKRWETQSYQEAVILWTMAKIISPNEFKILLNIASALRLSNRHDEAKEFIKLAAQNVPEGQEEQAQKYFDDWKKGISTILL